MSVTYNLKKVPQTLNDWLKAMYTSVTEIHFFASGYKKKKKEKINSLRTY